MVLQLFKYWDFHLKILVAMIVLRLMYLPDFFQVSRDDVAAEVEQGANRQVAGHRNHVHVVQL